MVLGALSGFTVGVTASVPSDEHARLTELGADVLVGPMVASDGQPPRDRAAAERLVAAAAVGGLDAVTFTTTAAVADFDGLAARRGLRVAVWRAAAGGSLCVACAGPSVAAQAASLGLSCRVEAPDARPGSLVSALADDLARRTTSLLLRDGTALVVRGRIVEVAGRPPVRPTCRELAVLGALVRRPGAVVSKRTLLAEVWAGESDAHVVEVTIARLRRRLGPAGGAIETVLRRGYRLGGR